MKRVIDDYFEGRMRSSGAVLIEGAKSCGKTRTAKEHAASILYMHEPDQREDNIKMAICGLPNCLKETHPD